MSGNQDTQGYNYIGLFLMQDLEAELTPSSAIIFLRPDGYKIIDTSCCLLACTCSLGIKLTENFKL